ncbi:class I adenylate-forming enzyme family protein [Streptomyces fuscichromogenes]|uniref:Acyl-CoA ligase n=1 Tax=Streptomyces fuscichromogenes TaxID=1324013 RepID=A0A917XG97_9ACTN|nr:AMP-binding protein [Streptomyces fuscichromogenes]GGN20141.1 putative acyl-CoA ligase [Streptomyces fuscichromogenes]
MDPEHGTTEYWAGVQPDKPAVICGDAVMTYREWNERADRVAEGLAALGLRQGDRLGMRFRLSIEWFVIQRALQKLGVAQVAVNWRLTPEEAMYIVRDSGARGLACDDEDPAGWGASDVGLLVTVGQAAGGPGARYEDLVTTPVVEHRFGPLRPSLVLYTSGTTGAPRGVPPVAPTDAKHAERLARYGATVAGVPPYPGHAVTLMTLPVHHGAGNLSATTTCAVGGTVVVLDPYDAEEAIRLIDRHKVQVWVAVPTMLLRIKSLPEEVLDRYDLSSLTALTTGAAPVPHSLKEWIIGRLGDDLLWEQYGASEVGMISFTPPEYQLTKPGTSGLPYEGVEIAIVDEDWNRLPAGETGEIAISSPVVIDHYLGDDVLEEHVLKDGFFRTGDVGHLDGDGFLYVTDRIKDMIVAGGVNIYPAEIEKVLLQHPAVADIAVIGVPQDDFGEQPMAYIVTKPSAKVTEEELVEFLGTRLASYKRPRKFAFIDELPVSPMGKILKRELRAPHWKGRARNV